MTTPDWQVFSELAGMIRPARVSVSSSEGWMTT